jgi:hypothetical protein
MLSLRKLKKEHAMAVDKPEEIKKAEDLVAKVADGGKLSENESRELTKISLEFQENGKFHDAKYTSLATSTSDALRKDGFLSRSEVDRAREVFKDVLLDRNNLDALTEQLEKSNPDARALNEAYIQEFHKALDLSENPNRKVKLEEHTFFGGITGHNDGVDERNNAKKIEISKSFVNSLKPALESSTLGLNEEDKTLMETLKMLKQGGGVIDDKRPEGSVDTGAPSTTTLDSKAISLEAK